MTDQILRELGKLDVTIVDTHLSIRDRKFILALDIVLRVIFVNANVDTVRDHAREKSRDRLVETQSRRADERACARGDTLIILFCAVSGLYNLIPDL